MGSSDESAWGDLGEEITRLDTAIYSGIAATRAPGVDHAMARLSRAADYSRISLAIAAALAALAGPAGRRAAAGGLASVVVTAAVVNGVLKPLARRRRPQRTDHSAHVTSRVEPLESHSFPSGHSAAAFAFAVGAGREAAWTKLPLAALATLVAYSRVHTGVHYPTDVIVGGLCGLALAEATGKAIEDRIARLAG